MIRSIKRHDDKNNDRQRLLRRILFYCLMTSISGGLLVFLYFAMKPLFLPLICGGLLAYVFRPIKGFFRVSWLPDHVRICAIFSALLLGLVWTAVMVRETMPDELGMVELKIRMQYRLNEKINELLREPILNGQNYLGRVQSEIQPLMEQLNEVLNLSADEKRLFLNQVNHAVADERPPLTYIYYYKSNLALIENVGEFEGPITVGAQRSPAHAKIVEPAKKVNEQKSSLKEVIHTLSNWLVMPLVFIFLLFDDGQIMRFILGLIPNRYFEVSMMVFQGLDDAIGRYLRGTLLECGLVGISLSIGLFLIGVPLTVSIYIGLISGFINAIPFLGPFIGMIIGLFYALIAENIQPILPFIGPEDLFLGVIVLVGLVHLLDNVVFQPIVLGSAVNLHPLVVVVGVIVGSISFGVAGMLLAIPTIVILKTITEILLRELKAYRII